MKGIIIILGFKNDSEGNLSLIAKERLDWGIKEYHKNWEHKILLTGDKGPHFNTTNKPHAYYAKQYLLRKGIPLKEILEFTESKNTVEDALLSKEIIESLDTNKVIVVTSDFHMARTKYIFNRFWKGYSLTFSEVKTEVLFPELEKLQAHETEALQELRNKWEQANN